MRVRIVQGVIVDRERRGPGDLVGVDDATGLLLVQSGKAEPLAEDPLPASAPQLRLGLIDISGIGVIELDVLAGLEIRDFADLAGADPKALAKALGVSQKAAKAMIADAIGFLG